MAIDLTIGCDPGRCWIENRNGLPSIGALRVWLSETGDVFVNGIGPRGRDLRGGICITAEAMDELAQGWLAGRNREEPRG